MVISQRIRSGLSLRLLAGWPAACRGEIAPNDCYSRCKHGPRTGTTRSAQAGDDQGHALVPGWKATGYGHGRKPRSSLGTRGAAKRIDLARIELVRRIDGPAGGDSFDLLGSVRWRERCRRSAAV